MDQRRLASGGWRRSVAAAVKAPRRRGRTLRLRPFGRLFDEPLRNPVELSRSETRRDGARALPRRRLVARGSRHFAGRQRAADVSRRRSVVSGRGHARSRIRGRGRIAIVLQSQSLRRRRLRRQAGKDLRILRGPAVDAAAACRAERSRAADQ